MQAALNTLGYNTSHGMTWVFDTSKHACWERAIDFKFYGIGEPMTLAQWDDLTAEYSALTDVPCCVFPDELVAMYPAAKVILIHRDEDKWVKSAENLIASMNFLPALILTYIIEPLKKEPSTGAESSRPAICMQKLFRGFFCGRNSEDIVANLSQMYRKHNAQVKELMQDRPDQFLEYKLGDGWEGLCSFLGKEVPVDTPFPHLNEKEEFKKMMYSVQMKFLKKAFDPIMANAMPLLVIAVSVCAWAVMRWM
jgi:hypothetical protein